MKGNKRARKPGDIENRFLRQMDHLYKACRAFDAGNETEADNIVIRLRILLHHRPQSNSHALLHQMNMLYEMNYVDSGVRRDLLTEVVNESIKKNKMVIGGASPSDTGLVLAGLVNGKGKFIAPLARNRFHPESYHYKCIVPKRNYEDWWKTQFIETTSGKMFSRFDIVYFMANQDGGAHVDPEIDADFDDFCQDFHNIEMGENFESLQPVEANIVYASVRQIAYELMATIDDHTGSDWVEKTINGSKRPPIFTMPLFTIIGENADE